MITRKANGASVGAETGARHIPCEKCPLRARAEFREFTGAELAFMAEFKRGELRIDKGATILHEGADNSRFYTVLSGWGFRYKMLDDGRRQIVNYAMPGDLVGLQGTLMHEGRASVEALSPMILCVFERTRLFSLFENFPQLSFDLTWIASREECLLDDNLLSIGRRTALEKVAYLMAFLVSRSVKTGLVGDSTMDVPVTQQHVADTLGLSLVHTNKTIRKLMELGLVHWSAGGCRVLDFEALSAVAGWVDRVPQPRPFL